eukprot:137047_1
MSTSSSDDDSDSDSDSIHGYECTLCNTIFDTPHQWKSHLKKYHLKTHRKKKKSKKKFTNIKVKKKSKHKHNKKSQRKRKRAFNKMINESDDHYSDNNINGRHHHNNNMSNKRRRQIFQCELCHKQYSRLSSYSKHYNHHMITNQKHICNFCLNQFRNQNELKKHINAFNGGMLVQNG